MEAHSGVWGKQLPILAGQIIWKRITDARLNKDKNKLYYLNNTECDVFLNRERTKK